MVIHIYDDNMYVSSGIVKSVLVQSRHQSWCYYSELKVHYLGVFEITHTIENVINFSMVE